jgi:hypothetical protein
MARKRFNFWLDDKRSEDWKINELITSLKQAGQFTRAIREGLRLWVDLRANKTDVLYELFPQMKSQITPVGGNGGGHSDLAKEIAAQIILQGGTSGYLMQSSLPSQKTAPPIAEIKQVMPVSDDELASNFLSMF